MMRNFLCWDPAAVRQVINPFAEHIPDSLFRAVHSDWNSRLRLRSANASRTSTQPPGRK